MAKTEIPHDTDYYELAYAQISRGYIKVCVFSSVVGVIGIFGNLLSISFYRKQSRTNINLLILALSTVDLIMSLLSFAHVYQSLANIKLGSSILCKVMYGLCHWFGCLSILLVAVIAVERYRGITMQKISPNLSTRVKWVIAMCTMFTMVWAVKVVLLVDIIPVKYRFDDIFVNNSNTNLNICNTKDKSNETVISLVSSRRLFSTLSTHPVEVFEDISPRMSVTEATVAKIIKDPENLVITVYKCNFSRTLERKIYVLLNHISGVLFVATMVLIFLFCYSRVLRTLVLHRKLTKWLHEERNTAKKNVKNIPFSGYEPSHTKASHSEPIGLSSEAHSLAKHILRKEDNNDLNTIADCYSKSLKGSKIFVTSSVSKSDSRLWMSETVSPKPRRDNLKTSEIQITLAMITVSIIVLLTYVPYFFATIYIQNLSLESTPLDGTSMVMLGCAFLNSVVNCFVYCVFSSSYRDYVKSLLCLISQRVRQTFKT